MHSGEACTGPREGIHLRKKNKLMGGRNGKNANQGRAGKRKEMEIRYELNDGWISASRPGEMREEKRQYRGRGRRRGEFGVILAGGQEKKSKPAVKGNGRGRRKAGGKTYGSGAHNIKEGGDNQNLKCVGQRIFAKEGNGRGRKILVRQSKKLAS